MLLIVFFDIQKAFDSSSHTGILIDLLNKGIKGKIFKWIHDFLSNRTFPVKIERNLSESFGVDSGVPQGAILSPIFFSSIIRSSKSDRCTQRNVCR